MYVNHVYDDIPLVIQVATETNSRWLNAKTMSRLSA